MSRAFDWQRRGYNVVLGPAIPLTQRKERKKKRKKERKQTPLLWLIASLWILEIVLAAISTAVSKPKVWRREKGKGKEEKRSISMIIGMTTK